MSLLLLNTLLLLQTHSLSAKATDVIDGNTLRLKSGVHIATVTLWGVKAPNLHHKEGQTAKKHLMMLVKDQTLTVTIKKGHEAVITYPFAGGAIVKVNTDMIAKGMARWDRHSAPHAKDLELWEQRAKQAKRGIWK